MKDSLLNRVLVIDRPEAGAHFASSRMQRILMMFARAPLSLKEASTLSNIELKRLHYYVRRLVEAGLIEVTSIRPRAGRPIKMYRAVASAFLVSNAALPRQSTDELTQELRHLLERDEAQASTGIRVSLGPFLEPKVELVSDDHRRRKAFELWRILRLRSAEFERLREELDGVLSRYQGLHDERGQVYLVCAAAAVRSRHEGVVDNAPTSASGRVQRR